MALSDTSSRWAIHLKSIVTGLAIFLLAGLSDAWLQQHGRSLLIAIVDDALVGIVAGLLVYFYERRQRQNLIRKLEVIRMMNHHVRNSLQVIALAASATPQEALAKRVQDAVERIEWTLREVLPGQREDIADLSFQPHVNESGSTLAS